MRSMTGFGRGTVTTDTSSVTIELKTVNNRFLDVNLRLPSELQHLEAPLKRLITARLGRGRVDMNMQYDRAAEGAFDLNRPMITAYLAAMNELKTDFGLSGDPDLNVIARLPNVIVQKRNELGSDFEEAAADALRIALDDLEAMRLTEGEFLAVELRQRLTAISQHLVPIEDAASDVADEYAARLKKRVDDIAAKLDSHVDVDAGRLAQEVAYLADRADIAEEVARLKIHLEHFRAIMTEEVDVGKRLDFLTQELNREANTITSKTNNMIVKENALAIKSEIEKIREQVQNIE